MEQGRTTLDSVLARNPNLRVSAKVASNHSQIVRKDSGRSLRPYARPRPPTIKGSAESMAGVFTSNVNGD
jgi:hypothetical protein